MQSRKYTAFKKSRKLGDVYGGRRWAKRTDNIHARFHSLTAPSPGTELPIVLRENPSRALFFPLNPSEVVAALQAIPDGAAESLTHVWFRRIRAADVRSGDLPLAKFICGSGVRVIVLYPWRRDLRRYVGKKSPKGPFANSLRKYAGSPILDSQGWYYQFTHDGLRRYYLEQLLLHELGHHVDWYRRHWSKANGRGVEAAANNYAVEWANSGVVEFVLE